MELDDSNFHNKNTQQLIDGVMSFLEDDSTEIFKNTEDFDESKNPLCAGIRTIIEMFPAPPQLPTLRHPLANLNTNFLGPREDHQKQFSANSRFTGNSCYEKVCRNKDPYINEVNRLMFCSTMGHPPHGSTEYFQAAEYYALYGKEFLDFPIDIKFPRPMEVGCFDGDVSMQFPNVFSKPNPSQGFPMQSGKYSTSSSVPQMPMMLNPASYWASYPCYQTPSLIQPLMYSNPFLMTQYLNMFVRETQINTSIVQQHQFLTGTGAGGIQERLVYAQMLQQQIQTNQTAQSQASFSSYSGHVGKPKVKLQDGSKNSGLEQSCCDGSDSMKTNGSNLYENNLEVDN